MMRALTLLLSVLTALPAAAQDRSTLGFGRLFVNDALGDARDRWQTGSYSFSYLRGPTWGGSLTTGFGEVLEFRARGSIIAPEDLADPAPGDRRYAGTVALGLHTHFALGRAEARVGLDLVAIGPQTGLGRFQQWVHDIFALPEPDLSDQIGNRLMPTLSAEVGRSFALGAAASVRPFIEAQAGAESFVRAGADLTFGQFGEGALMIREPVTGQRYAGIRGTHGRGFTALLGADVARVFDSAYLPDAGTPPEDIRTRVRAGLHWQGERVDVFYGVTWLSEEFGSQSEGQVVGALRVNVQF